MALVEEASPPYSTVARDTTAISVLETDVEIPWATDGCATARSRSPTRSSPFCVGVSSPVKCWARRNSICLPVPCAPVPCGGRSPRTSWTRPGSTRRSSAAPCTPPNTRRSACSRSSPPATAGTSEASPSRSTRTPSSHGLRLRRPPGRRGLRGTRLPHGRRLADRHPPGHRVLRVRGGVPVLHPVPKCGNGNDPLHKRGAVRLLTVLLRGAPENAARPRSGRRARRRFRASALRRRFSRARPRPDLGGERSRGRRRRDVGDLAHDRAPHEPAALGRRDTSRRDARPLLPVRPVVGGRERRQIGRTGRTVAGQHDLACASSAPDTAHRAPITQTHQTVAEPRSPAGRRPGHVAFSSRRTSPLRPGVSPLLPHDVLGATPLPRGAVRAEGRRGPVGARRPAHAPVRPPVHRHPRPVGRGLPGHLRDHLRRLLPSRRPGPRLAASTHWICADTASRAHTRPWRRAPGRAVRPRSPPSRTRGRGPGPNRRALRPVTSGHRAPASRCPAAPR